jgi:hypothetical protein
MTRSRIWILTLLAAPLVAGPALAYSWPALFGLPAVFGQETPQSAAHPMPYADAAPTRCPKAGSCQEVQCELLGDCLATWRKLWEQGRFREAYRLAQCAAQAAPNSVDAQHALAVSQVIINPQFQPINPDLRFFAQYAPVSGMQLYGTRVIAFGPEAITPDRTASFDIECKVGECPLTGFFSTIFGCCKNAKSSCCEKCSSAGCCSKEGCCAKCCKTESVSSAEVLAPSVGAVERMIQRKLETPVSLHWKDTPLQQILEDMKTLTNLNVVPDMQALHDAGICLSMPMSLSVDNVKLKSALNLLLTQAKLDYVIKDQVVQITTMEKANRCCEPTGGQSDCCIVRAPAGQSGPTMIWIIREPAPTMAPMIGGLTPPMLPAIPVVDRDEYGYAPPYIAPPPPPFVSPPDYLQFVPVPVPQLAPPRPAPVSYVWANGPPQIVPVPPPAPQAPYVRAVQFEQAEVCEPIPPATCVAMPSEVRITQDGNRVRFTSPKYSAQCDRIRGGAKGQFILEGNVQLVSRRHGQTMSISAQRVVLNMTDDQFVVEQAEGMESTRVNVAPIGLAARCYGTDIRPDGSGEVYQLSSPCTSTAQELAVTGLSSANDQAKAELDKCKGRLEMHQAERKAYVSVLEARIKEFAVGKQPTPEFVLDAHARLCKAIANENQAMAQYYEALMHCSALPSRTSTPVRIHDGVGP